MASSFFGVNNLTAKFIKNKDNLALSIIEMVQINKNIVFYINLTFKKQIFHGLISTIIANNYFNVFNH